jgi:hypothetical protein
MDGLLSVRRTSLDCLDWLLEVMLETFASRSPADRGALHLVSIGIAQSWTPILQVGRPSDIPVHQSKRTLVADVVKRLKCVSGDMAKNALIHLPW